MDFVENNWMQTKNLKAVSVLICLLFFYKANSQTLVVSSSVNGYTLTCNSPSMILTSGFVYSMPSPWVGNAKWQSPYSGTIPGYTLLVTAPGIYTTIVTDNITSDTLMIPVFSNTILPTVSISPNSASVSCTQSIQPQFNLITVSASQNFSSFILPPHGGTVMVNSNNLSYQANNAGTYTYVVKDNTNGCVTESYFSINTDSTMPVVPGAIGSFTTGCINGAVVSCSQVIYAGAVTYTILGPGVSTTPTPGPLSLVNTYTLNVPGNYTYVVRGNGLCNTYLPFTIRSNTASPGVSVTPNAPTLNCFNPSLTLNGVTSSTNASFQWLLPGSASVSGPTLALTTTTTNPTNTLFATYTLIVTDQNNQCTSFITFPVLRNFFIPIADFTSNTGLVLGCPSNTILLQCAGRSTIPPNLSLFSYIVAGYFWEGPSPQQPAFVSATYLAYTPGIYTLTVRDLNNGCMASTTKNVIYDPYCVGVKEELSNVQTRIYPNPSTGRIKIQYTDPGDIEVIEIYDQLGTEVMNISSDGLQQELDLPLPNGLYYLKVQIGGKRSIAKLIIKK